MIDFIDGQRLRFDKLCLAMGVKPKVIVEHPLVLGLRDTPSIENMIERLKGAQCIAVVGNGGIALELIHEVSWRF
jgi:pyridine nucleotide-disulfide oxidoreductase domain-containing protein 1